MQAARLVLPHRMRRKPFQNVGSRRRCGDVRQMAGVSFHRPCRAGKIKRACSPMPFCRALVACCCGVKKERRNPRLRGHGFASA
ncbi:MAG: hypothetical protein ACLSTO_06565 [Bilophila wadsworthia]